MDGSLQSILTAKESLEGLQHQLLCTSMELEYIRKASKEQAKLNDITLQHLQEILDATKKERDEAFQECKKLQKCLFLSTDPKEPENVARYACPTYSSRHSDCMFRSSDNALRNPVDTVSKAQKLHSMRTLSKDQHLQSILCLEASEELEFSNNTLEHYDLPFLDEAKVLQENKNFSGPREQFSMDIFDDNMAFDELESLNLTELQVEENLISKWEADLTKSWEASLSSPSSVISTAASQLQSKTNGKKHTHVSTHTTTTSLTEISAGTDEDSFFADRSMMRSQQPMATTTKDRLSSASPSITAMSSNAPIAKMSMQWCASPLMPSMSASQSASALAHISNQLCMSAKVSPSIPSMSASQLASPIAYKSNHLSMSAVASTSTPSMSSSRSASPNAFNYNHSSMSPEASLSIPSMSVSQSVSPIANMSNHVSMSAKPSPSITALSASSWAMPVFQSAAMSAHQYSYMLRRSIPPSSTSSPEVPRISASTCETTSPLALPLPHFPTISSPQASAKVKKATQTQMAASVLPQKRRHLPEPPEANMDVMLSSLPEKGKLLEAVMRAGPLLQQLLLAGPLPQWHHPPPQLNTMDILRVPTSPNSVLAPLSHVQHSPPSSCIRSSQLPFAYTTNSFAPYMSCMHKPSSSSSKTRKLTSQRMKMDIFFPPTCL